MVVADVTYMTPAAEVCVLLLECVIPFNLNKVQYPLGTALELAGANADVAEVFNTMLNPRKNFDVPVALRSTLYFFDFDRLVVEDVLMALPPTNTVKPPCAKLPVTRFLFKVGEVLRPCGAPMPATPLLQDPAPKYHPSKVGRETKKIKRLTVNEAESVRFIAEVADARVFLIVPVKKITKKS